MKFSRHQIPAQSAITAELEKGQTARIVNAEGGQVVDTWAFSSQNNSEYLSMSHSRTATYHLFFQPGDVLVSNLFNPILTFVSDSSACTHDTLHAACSAGSNLHFKSDSAQPNCQNNFYKVFEERGVSLSTIPDPWNLFEETRVNKDGGLVDVSSLAKIGDYIEIRDEQDILLVCSACPSMVGNISGESPRGACLDIEVRI